MDLNKLVRENIKGLKPYTSARDQFKGDYIFLDANENPYGRYNRYPDPQQSALKSKISELRNIPTENIFLGNGSDEVLDLIFRVFCEPGKDEVLIFSPSYGMYEVIARINDISIEQIELNDSFKIEYEKLDAKLESGDFKLAILCSPNNPSGHSYSKEEIYRVLENFKGIVLIDEAYIDFADQDSWQKEFENFPNLIVIQTLSKSFGLAGLRIGMAFANEEVISYLNKIKPPYNISSANQDVALEVLNNVAKIDSDIQNILNQKNRILQVLQKLSFVKKTYSSDANFILAEFTNPDELFEFMIDRKIILRKRHKDVANTIRISIGSEKENDLLIKALNDYEKEKGTFSR